jgi:hypothetical protein
VFDIAGKHDPGLRWQLVREWFDGCQSDANGSLQGRGWPYVTDLETRSSLYAVGLAQNLKRTCDIEQEEPWWDYDEDRDMANIVSARSRVRRADKWFISAIEYSGFRPWP